MKKYFQQTPCTAINLAASTLLTLFALMILSVSLRELFKAVDTIGGVDFYYYLCTARDRVYGVSPHNPRTMSYFPGFYWIWGGVISWFGENIKVIQQFYLASLLLNASLIGCIVKSLRGTFSVSLVSASVYLWCALQVEGMEACLETLTTIPFFGGLLAWSYHLQRGRALLSMFCAGLGAALAVFIKQQALLLVVGGVGILPLLRRKTSPALCLKELGIGSVTFIVTLLLLFVLDTDGLKGLITGVNLVTSYESRGSFYTNLLAPILTLRPVIEITGILCIGVLLLSFTQEKSDSNKKLSRVVVLITTIAAATSLYQFSRRGYLHYALVTVAPLAVALGVALQCILTELNGAKGRGRAISWATIAAVIVAAVTYRSSFPAQYQRIQSLRLRLPATEISAPFLPICQYIPRRSELFVFPSRRNIIHWLCGTTSTIWNFGYGFAPAPLSMFEDTIKHPDVNYVFVTDPSIGDYNNEVEIQLQGAPIRALLASEGFISKVSLESGELFQREASPLLPPRG